jgi:hypothetical protein
MRQLRVGLVVFLLCLIAASCSTEQTEELQPLAKSEVSDAIQSRRDGPPTLSIVYPEDGAQVRSPFAVQIQARNLELAPSGTSADGEGHFHVRINEHCVESGAAIPVEENTLHIGSGKSTTEVDLTPGRYELCVQIGDGFHVAVNVVDTVEIWVVE